MTDKTIAVLPGDGIGPEVMKEGTRVLQAVAQKYGHNFNFVHALVGGVAYDRTGYPLPPETLKACEEADCIILLWTRGR